MNKCKETYNYIIFLDVFVCDSETRFVCFHPDTPGVYASYTDRNVRLEAANTPGGVMSVWT